MRVLILGGTGEARDLAAAAVSRPGWQVVSSLAGRVTNPALPVGEVRIGGFGGAAGLVHYLAGSGIEAIVDATHPFAATISGHAARAAALARRPLLALRRPGWVAGPGDRWLRVPDIAAAAATAAAAPPGCIFVTTGRRDLGAFAQDAGHTYLVRTVDPPDGALPPRATLLLDRGPFTVQGETALLYEHDVGLLVTKDSGGAMTAAKLTAARERAIAVVMVDRPDLPAGVAAVDSVDAAIAWLGSLDAQDAQDAPSPPGTAAG
ncbi:MAG: cobalt-precorrin-6A reductase [Actinomycetota bacterium]|nr:cobalt-precorrin-6A reductase [Actinomycetota bacterium]